jgi:hypothetical protein
VREAGALAEETVCQLVLFIWFVRSVWFVFWLHETNQIDQITRQTGLVPHVGTMEVLLRRNVFSQPARLEIVAIVHPPA